VSVEVLAAGGTRTLAHGRKVGFLDTDRLV
jgi:hypothetical protein